MISFLDGPAKGQVMVLKRVPQFLRVVQNSNGDIDALDQFYDTPSLDESIYAYQTEGEVTRAHIRVSGSRKAGKSTDLRSGFYWMAKYRLCPVQPSDSIMRSAIAWGEWAAERASVLNPATANSEPDAT